MKFLRSSLYLALACVLYSCSNQELAYNEKATELFLQEMKGIDDDQKAFADSNLVFHPTSGDLISLNIKAENIQSNSQRDIQNMNDLKPSEPAKTFHQSVLTYFGKIDHYGATAKKLIAADSVGKRALYTQLLNEYESLNQMPDEVLEIQKKYLNQVGLKAK